MTPYIAFQAKQTDGTVVELRMFDNGTGGWYDKGVLVREATAEELESARKVFWPTS